MYRSTHNCHCYISFYGRGQDTKAAKLKEIHQHVEITTEMNRRRPVEVGGDSHGVNITKNLHFNPLTVENIETHLHVRIAARAKGRGIIPTAETRAQKNAEIEDQHLQ